MTSLGNGAGDGYEKQGRLMGSTIDKGNERECEAGDGETVVPK